jgi:hypothetical protein
MFLHGTAAANFSKVMLLGNLREMHIYKKSSNQSFNEENTTFGLWWEGDSSPEYEL